MKMSTMRNVGLGAALAAGLALQPAMAQERGISVSDNGRGNAVFVPYYTINNGWRTLINVTNTSSNSLAVKVRLHEARNSRDVLDFIVLLSPFDVWTAWVSNVNGEPFMQTTDRSCTIPEQVRASGAAASAVAYSGQFRDHTDTDGDINRMSEGYIELLVMGETTGEGNGPASGFRGDTAWFAKHVNGEPRDCDAIQNDFVRRTPEWGGTPSSTVPGTDLFLGQTGSGSPLARRGAIGTTGPNPANAIGPSNESIVGYGPNRTADPLKVNASLVNQSTGRAAGVESLHIQGFALGVNLMAAQQFPWFLEPTLASDDGLWTKAAVEFFLDDIGASQVMNEWTNNPNTGAGSDWVVTFPTKRFQADEDAFNIQSACNVWRNASTGFGVTSFSGDQDDYPIWAGWTVADGIASGHRPRELSGLDFGGTDEECTEQFFPRVFQDGNNGRAELVVVFDIFDREEGTVRFTVDGPVISPSVPDTVDISSLPFEVNVLKVGRNAALLPTALNSQIADPVDTSELVSNSNVGWMIMSFLDGNEEETAYPVTGFLYKERDFGNPALNFGQATEHGYKRAFPDFELENGLIATP